jgi:AraC family transcriptional regulator of adaptative response/methylated-DNA-[protein]-cysteine methyltransferase
MPEVIRFSWGTSLLGDFMIAMSDCGLVALEMSSHHTSTEQKLFARFCEADIIQSPGGLRGVVERVNRAIEEPGFDPAIPLDLRGTTCEAEIWSMLRAILAAEMTNCGSLVTKLETHDVREVKAAIASNPIAILIPCHRVSSFDGTAGATSASANCSRANGNSAPAGTPEGWYFASDL